jgi:hypothetical protein
MTGQKVEEAAAGQVRENPGMGSVDVAAEVPRYQALGKLCLEPGWREIAAGAVFEHDGPATNGMRPLNAPARQAKLASIGPRWREARPQQISRLARSLGFTGGTDGEAAAAHIKNWVARETEIQKETSS